MRGDVFSAELASVSCGTKKDEVILSPTFRSHVFFLDLGALEILTRIRLGIEMSCSGARSKET